MMTIGEAITKSAEYLQKKGIETPRLDAELLLARIMNCDRLRLYMDWKKPVVELELAAYRDFLRRRGQEREPVSRIVGRRSFYRREFMVTPDTFVPRPETEGVVERALMLLEKEPALTKGRQTIFEVGTGTGCIIVSMACESDAHHYIASDVSPGALATARKNAHQLHVDGRIEFRNGPVFAGFEGTLSLVVSNPPYIERDTIPGLPPEVRLYDPMAALDGGADGLDVVREIALGGRRLLIPGGWVVLEIGEGQAQKTAHIFQDTGGYGEHRIERDLAGIERYVLIRKE